MYRTHYFYFSSFRAGVGRTGVYIVLDTMLDRAQAQNDVDIFNYIASMRTRRIAMVQTEVSHNSILRSEISFFYLMVFHL